MRAGKKLPANPRRAGVKFRELSDTIPSNSASHQRDARNVKSGVKEVLPDSGGRAAWTIRPEEIDAWLAMHTVAIASLTFTVCGRPRGPSGILVGFHERERR
jgi:hypothetical protein